MNAIIVILYIFNCVNAIDIAAVYGPGLIIVKNADEKLIENHRLNSLTVNLSSSLAYPICLAYDSENGTFFISDANNRNIEIFSFSLQAYHPKKVRPFVAQMRHSTIQDISLNPMEKILYWTDSVKHGIYYTYIEDDTPTHSKLLFDSNVLKPKSIAVNYCDRVLYWTESGTKGSSSIVKHRLGTNSSAIFKQSHNSFFQGLHYNAVRNELIWAETTNEDVNSSCKIVSKLLNEDEEIAIVNTDNCFPFSLTSDEKYVYWSDWSRQSIMRAPLTDPSIDAVTEIAKTPSITTNEGEHNGAFSIVAIRESSDILHCTKDGTSMPALKELAENLVFREKQSPIYTQKVSVINSSEEYKDLDKDKQFYLIIALIAVTILCILFGAGLVTFSTLYWRQCEKLKKYLSPVTSAGASNPDNKPAKIHRTFRKHSNFLAGELHPKNDNDGVRIEIEDCCQMTLCDAPCLTRMKNEGKLYCKSLKKSSDKVALLSGSEASL